MTNNDLRGLLQIAVGIDLITPDRARAALKDFRVTGQLPIELPTIQSKITNKETK